MNRRGKIILAAVLLLVVAVLLRPRLPLSQQNITEFRVTEQPVQALEVARAAGRPIFLEFYARW